jgi:hypothetical protein
LTGRVRGCPATAFSHPPVLETGLKPPRPERGGFRLSCHSSATQIVADDPTE